VSSDVGTDLDNQARPNGDAPDIGADEWYGLSMTYRIDLPLVRK